MESSFSLILDIVVSLLLVATIIFAVRLNKRLGSLRREKKDLEAFAASFNTAITRAEGSISFLKETTDGLEDQVNKAQALRDDLAFLTERGGAAADRLEDAIRTSRKDLPGVSSGASPAVTPTVTPAVTPVAPPPVSGAIFGPGSSGDGRQEDEGELKSEAERELLRALQTAR